MQVFLLLFSVLSGILGALAALIAGLPGPTVALSYVACGSLGLLTAAGLLACRMSGEETNRDST